MECTGCFTTVNERVPISANATAVSCRLTCKLGREALMNLILASVGWGVFAIGACCWPAIPVSAQTNEMLFQERLISLPVYELLNSRGATTPEQRVQVISEACRDGLLGPEDCVQRRR